MLILYFTGHFSEREMPGRVFYNAIMENCVSRSLFSVRSDQRKLSAFYFYLCDKDYVVVIFHQLTFLLDVRNGIARLALEVLNHKQVHFLHQSG